MLLRKELLDEHRFLRAPEFLLHVLEMALDGAMRDAERVADFLGGRPGHEEPGDIVFRGVNIVFSPGKGR